MSKIITNCGWCKSPSGKFAHKQSLREEMWSGWDDVTNEKKTASLEIFTHTNEQGKVISELYYHATRKSGEQVHHLISQYNVSEMISLKNKADAPTRNQTIKDQLERRFPWSNPNDVLTDPDRDERNDVPTGPDRYERWEKYEITENNELDPATSPTHLTVDDSWRASVAARIETGHTAALNPPLHGTIRTEKGQWKSNSMAKKYVAYEQNIIMEGMHNGQLKPGKGSLKILTEYEDGCIISHLYHRAKGADNQYHLKHIGNFNVTALSKNGKREITSGILINDKTWKDISGCTVSGVNDRGEPQGRWEMNDSTREHLAACLQEGYEVATNKAEWDKERSCGPGLSGPDISSAFGPKPKNQGPSAPANRGTLFAQPQKTGPVRSRKPKKGKDESPGVELPPWNSKP